MKRLLHDNGLSIVLTLLFLVFWLAQAVTGHLVFNEESVRHGQPGLPFIAYLGSGHFWQATAENWESEFLQMGAYVVLTVFLFQRGSAESNDPDEKESLREKRRASRHSWLHRNSLAIAFLALFLGSFVLHAAGGLRAFNDERLEHGEPPATLSEFLSDPEFWFQSFQNWQSEFLAVLSIVVLSIFLRQNGSPESKDMEAPDSSTGS